MAKGKVQTYQTDDLIIEIDESKCISCGTCSAIAPQTFELDDKLMSVVKQKPKGSTKIIIEAAQSCAVEGIIIKDKKTGRKLN